MKSATAISYELDNVAIAAKELTAQIKKMPEMDGYEATKAIHDRQRVP